MSQTWAAYSSDSFIIAFCLYGAVKTFRLDWKVCYAGPFNQESLMSVGMYKIVCCYLLFFNAHLICSAIYRLCGTFAGKKSTLFFWLCLYFLMHWKLWKSLVLTGRVHILYCHRAKVIAFNLVEYISFYHGLSKLIFIVASVG